jgi:uncharacterized protein
MLMLLNMKEVTTKGNPVHLAGRIDVADLLKGRKDVVSFSSAEADLQATALNGTTVEVSGTISMDVEQNCSRCLEPVKQSLDIPFQEAFTQSSKAAEEDDNLLLVTEDKIELKPYIEETVLLELPYIPLCDEDCKGLCPVCGTNRNVTPCACKQEKIDPRLAGLADFFDR